MKIDTLVKNIQKTNAPIVVGLDPMLGYLPKHILDKAVKEHGDLWFYSRDQIINSINDSLVVLPDSSSCRL